MPARRDSGDSVYNVIGILSQIAPEANLSIRTRPLEKKFNLLAGAVFVWSHSSPRVPCYLHSYNVWTSEVESSICRSSEDQLVGSYLSGMMSSNDELAKKVEVVIAKRAIEQDTPADTDLFPIFNFLVPSHCSNTSSSSPPSISPGGHWYCSKVQSALHREAATYMIILFAFRREGMSGTWVTALEGVLIGCDECARAFGAARRRFGTKCAHPLHSGTSRRHS